MVQRPALTKDSDRLNCKTASRMLSDGQDKLMSPSELARLRLHLVVCEACRNFDEQMQFLRRALRRMDRDEGDLP